MCKRNAKRVVFTSTKAVRLHDIEVVRKYTRNLIKGFSKYKNKWKQINTTPCTYISFLYKFVNHLCKNTSGKVILLIDFGKFQAEDNVVTEQLSNLVQLVPTSQNLQAIIAFTIASGEFISDDYVYCIVQKVLYDGMVERVYFKGFDELEAKTFLNYMNPSFIFDDVKPYTGCNLSLLSLTAHTDTLSKLGAAVNDAVVHFVNNNLPDSTSLKSIYIDRLSMSEYFFTKAINGDVLDEYDIRVYLNSWISKHHACIFQEDPFILKLNFPLLPNIL